MALACAVRRFIAADYLGNAVRLRWTAHVSEVVYMVRAANNRQRIDLSIALQRKDLLSALYVRGNE